MDAIVSTQEMHLVEILYAAIFGRTRLLLMPYFLEIGLRIADTVDVGQ